jgi:RNA-directed DNA polymerase
LERPAAPSYKDSGTSKMIQDQMAVALADALLAGPASVEDFAARLAQALGRKHRWLRAFAKRVFRHFGAELVYAQRHELTHFIRSDAGYKKAWAAPDKPRMRRYFFAVPAMGRRNGVLADCVLPDIPTPGDLAAWLGITITQLQWFADLRGMIDSAEGALCHYRYQWIPKRHGDYRLIESPKARLCAIQRKILREILDPVPAHEAAHGFRRGHSCMSYAAPHVGRQVVLRMDLRNFFGSIPAGRINALFRTLGYPEETARYLTGLCTNRIRASEALKVPGADPEFVLPWLERKKLSEPHLPQGAPTSPALANLCALHLDFRLASLAGKMDAQYTRYADDLAFSGDEPVRRRAQKLSDLIAATALDEGFEVNFRKTRFMHKSDRQILTGIVVNEKINVHRREFEQLKAILHNCLRSGPDSQNRDGHGDFRAHLSGRVNHVKRLNPARGTKLQALLERIDW